MKHLVTKFLIVSSLSVNPIVGASSFIGANSNPVIQTKLTEVVDPAPIPAPAVEPEPVYVYTPVYSPGNGYIGGQCTWGVKNWRPDIPNNWHNAYQWLGNAQAQGWPTGSVPVVGAIAWNKNYSHVALVIGISGARIIIKEMNFNGPYIIDTRDNPTANWLFIY